MIRLSTPPALLFACGILALLLTLSETGSAGGDEQGAPAAQESPDRKTLLQRHDALAQQVHALWQQGQDRQAYEGLQELLALYHQIYPPAEFPQGHPHLVRCYRDLCRVSEQLGERDALLKYGQEGVALCRRLYPRQEHPHGHVQLAIMCANLGNAWTWHSRPDQARACLLEAIEMSRALADRGEDTLSPTAIANLLLSVAATWSRQGDDLQTLQYTTQAVQCCENPPANEPYLQSLQTSAKCLLRHGQALMCTGDYQQATVALQRALDLSLHVFLAERSPSSHLALVDAHVEMGVLQRLKSDLPSAKWHLLRAQEEVEGMDESWGRSSEVLAQLLWLAQLEGTVLTTGVVQQFHKSAFSHSPSSGRTGSPRELEEINRLLDLGMVRQSLGDYALAENLFRSARKTAFLLAESSRSGPRSPAIWPDLYLGKLLMDLGRYQDAHFHLVAALSIANAIYSREAYPRSHPVLANVTHNAATLYWLLGETGLAASLYQEAMAMQERLYPVEEYPRGHRLLMASYMGWGNVLEREGDYDDAARYLNKAHAIAVQQYPEAEYPSGHDELAMVEQSLGRLQRALGNYAAALIWFQKVLASYEDRYAAAFPNGHVLISMALSELGRTWAAAGDPEQARDYLEQSLAMRRRWFSLEDYPHGHPLLANVLRDLGQLHRKCKRNDEAYEAFAEAARMEQAVAESFIGGGSEALLLNLAARKFRALDCLLDAWCQTDRAADEVYDYAWQRRGFVPRLIAQRRRAMRSIASAEPDADRDAYLEVRRELSRALLVSAVRDAEGEASRLATVRRLNVRKETLEDQLARELVPVQTALAPGELRAAALSAALPADAVLVDYVQYQPDSGRLGGASPSGSQAASMLAFVVAAGRAVRCVQLGDASSIERLARAWREDLLQGRHGDSGDRLRQLVWDPVCQHFPELAHRVYIAPDGALSLIPFHALPLGDGTQLLIEKYATAMVPYGAFLLEQLTAPRAGNGASDGILAVGGLDYGSPPPATNEDALDMRRLGLKRLVWSPLTGSSSELASLMAFAGTRHCVRLMGSNATTDRVMSELGRTRWAHFATHGFFVDEELDEALRLAGGLQDGQQLEHNSSRTTVLQRSPFVRSGLALSGANELGELDELGIPRQAHGILTAEMIAASDCGGLDLVVLSACETGRGDVVHGDGVFGTQMAFHVAGARNVVATLWKIDDEATAELMYEFYRLLWGEGATPLQALRGAQLAMIRQARAAGSQLRGPELSNTVPLPSRPPRASRSALSAARRWAAFTLSGPGF